MFCPKCGKELENDAAFCGYCGAQMKDPAVSGTYTQPAYANATPAIDRGTVSKKEFIEKYASPALRKSINSMAITCYILAAVSAVFGIAWTHNFYALIDVVILLALTLGMHLGKSKICAIILLIVSIIECVLTTINMGMLSGWWWIIASASAVASFVRLDKEYNSFLLEGAKIPSSAPTQPYVPTPESVQPTEQTNVYYTPSQPAEPESAPEQTAEDGENQD